MGSKDRESKKDCLNCPFCAEDTDKEFKNFEKIPEDAKKRYNKKYAEWKNHTIS